MYLRWALLLIIYCSDYSFKQWEQDGVRRSGDFRRNGLELELYVFGGQEGVILYERPWIVWF